MVKVRLPPLPPNLKLAAERRFEFEEVALTAKLAAGVSRSPMVKAMGPVLVSSLIV